MHGICAPILSANSKQPTSRLQSGVGLLKEKSGDNSSPSVYTFIAKKNTKGSTSLSPAPIKTPNKSRPLSRSHRRSNTDTSAHSTTDPHTGASPYYAEAYEHTHTQKHSSVIPRSGDKGSAPTYLRQLGGDSPYEPLPEADFGSQVINLKTIIIYIICVFVSVSRCLPLSSHLFT